MRAIAPLRAADVGVEPEDRAPAQRLARSCSSRSVPAPWRATDDRAAVRARSGHPLAVAAVVAARPRPAARCRTSVTSQCGHSHTRPQERQERKFDQPRRLSRTIALRRVGGSRAPRGVSGCSGAAVAAHVERPRRAAAAAVDALRAARMRRSACDALGARRGAAADQHGAASRRAARRRGGRRSAGRPRACRRSRAPRRRRSGRGRSTGAKTAERGPTHDARLAAAQAQPLVVALARDELGVQDRDGVAEARRGSGRRSAASARSPGRARSRRGRARARLGGRAQVDLGLARARDAVQQQLGVA